MNTINLMGRLVRDPELRWTQGKEPKAVCRFTLAVRRNADATDFIDCIAWQGTGEMIEKYCKKGDMLAVTGALQIENWETEKGEKRKSAEVNVRSAYFCESRKQEEEPKEEQKKYSRR